MAWAPPDLKGKTAIVAGATRGTGRGIATALGEAGATVYCTGRSSGTNRSPMDRAETIEETAALVDAAGGKGIPVRVDHSDPLQIAALMASVKDAGGLDILVNDIWGIDAQIPWGQPFWESDGAATWGLLENAMRTHWLTAHAAVPIMNPGGTVVEVTDGNTLQYRGNVLYDLIKTSIIRMTYGMHQDLEAKGMSAVCVTPGFLRSEAMLDHFGVTAETWTEAKDPDFIASETPLFVGRGVAHLAADQGHPWEGRVVASWTLSDHYGFSDVDGSQPHWGRHFEREYEPLRPMDDALLDYWRPMTLGEPE